MGRMQHLKQLWPGVKQIQQNHNNNNSSSNSNSNSPPSSPTTISKTAVIDEKKSILLTAGGSSKNEESSEQHQQHQRPSFGDIGGVTFPFSRVFRRGGNRTNHYNNNCNKICEESSPETICKAIHQACSDSTSTDIQVIKYLIAKYPNNNGGKAKRKDGNLPLHTSCANNPTVELIEYLIEVNPDATGTRNARGKLPIHIAVECGASLECIQVRTGKKKQANKYVLY